MALYYAGNRFWDPKLKQEVTVCTPATRDRSEWVNAMKQWAKERDIPLQWYGESTHTNEDQRWHEAQFLIAGEENRLMFLLAWGGSSV